MAMAASLPPPPHLLASSSSAAATIKTLASNLASGVRRRRRLLSDLPPPVAALRRGDWVKLICGASFEDATDVRNLSLVYALAGVDCIDCAADASVVGAVNEGIDLAASIVPALLRPWVMVSVNDDCKDLHFRKAEFDPEDCPPDCSRPCETVCPADAILLERVSTGGNSGHADSSWGKLKGGVVVERCYGCGRCLSVCPYDRIRAASYVRDPTMTAELLKRDDVDAIEIHTTGKGTDMFNDLWGSLGESKNHVKLVAVSLPDVGESTVDFMNEIYTIMQSHPQCYNLWQLDGRPMSGDIGRGATKETIAFAVRLASEPDKPHGFYQLAGGTNSHTIDCLKKAGLFQCATFPGTASSDFVGSQQALIGGIAGIAYGGYARKIVGKVVRKVPTRHGHVRIEDHPEYLLEALQEALSLVGPVKGYEESCLQNSHQF